MTGAVSAPATTVGFRALARREVVRVTKLWTQTIAAPVISSALFIVVFGLSLGGRIPEIGGIDYEVFIVPGLITMAIDATSSAVPISSARTTPPMFSPRLTCQWRIGAASTSCR